ncbi:uncharacterized protein LOC116195598 [Punica granatum]|uniref:Phorbol-ester/DAG-type domain-containing protein n=2 Tax=Punica granatum TaxID=22663 RepID=A0A218X6G4_PUNGR|nr:uncharacterized protein LOC116195598 [Punica granatum]OWM80524.1 hypothetical protein CDL15_Pgr019804 [Punica granatum]PKI52554.1 hypothetical protein CRG98_027126 [Punica granatum]
MKIEKEIYNLPIHRFHKLKLEYTETPFNCDGCKEAGIGLKYKCCQCEFDLHKACALATSTATHPFYKKCEFQLHHRPPGLKARVCDACRDEVSGLEYHCDRCGFDLHPCCASLPRVLDDGERNLILCARLSGPCHWCGGKGLGWAYRSSCKTYSLHVSCVKQLLVESWEAVYLNVDKDRVREMHTRIPSLGNTLRAHHVERGGKMGKCCELAKGAVRLIVSAILGDPTAIIAGVIQSFISK